MCFHFHLKEKTETFKAYGNQVETSFDESVKDDERKRAITHNITAHNNLDILQINVNFKKVIAGS